MNKLLFTLVLVLSQLVSIKAQTPDWADEGKRKLQFPENEFLTGFSSEKNIAKEDQNALLDRLVSYAKSQLAEYIQVNVQSEAVQQLVEANEKVQQNYRAIFSASSKLELTGLKVEKVYDAKSKIGYALAYARKNELNSYYKGIIENDLVKASQKIEEAKSALNGNDVQNALKSCLESNNILIEVEQAQKVILALKAGKISETDIQSDKVAQIRLANEDIIRQAQHNSGNTVDDASLFIARGLKLQTGKVDKPVQIANFTYQDTKMSSQLSRRLSQALALKLVSEGEYSIQTEGASGSNGLILTGTFWKEEKDIRILGTLKDISGKIIASAEAFVPLSWFQSNDVSYMPENFEDAYTKMRIFTKNEIVKGDINLEVLTNKGDDNLLYTEGEKLKFYVRVNKECYLRFIYYTADGQKVLLLDNYYIAENMVNKMVELPYEFECSEPFGVETLVANAQSTEFPKLSINHSEGFDFINDNVDQILVTCRSMKKVVNKNEPIAEKKLIFTTMKR